MEICFYPIKMHEEWNRIKDTFYRGWSCRFVCQYWNIRL